MLAWAAASGLVARYVSGAGTFSENVTIGP
jgi:hypothetical protein